MISIQVPNLDYYSLLFESHDFPVCIDALVKLFLYPPSYSRALGALSLDFEWVSPSRAAAP